MTDARRGEFAGHLAMLAFAVFISGSFALGGQAAPHIAPEAITAMRFLLAVLVMGLFVWLTGNWRRSVLEAPWRYLILGGLQATYFVLMFRALQITDPVSTGAVFTLMPLMAAGFGWLFLRQVSPLPVLFAFLVGGLGALWVIFRGDVADMAAFNFGPGERIFLVGCACHAAFTPLSPKLRRGEPLPAYTLMSLIGAGILVFAYGSTDIAATDWRSLPPVVWLTIVYLAVFTTAITFFLVQFAAIRLPSGKVMAYGYLVPSFVIIWEGVSGRGWVSPIVWIGVAATIAALLMLLREDNATSRVA